MPQERRTNFLAQRETKTVTLALTPAVIQLLDRDMHWVVVPGDIEIMVGKSSADLPIKGKLKVGEQRADTKG